MESHLTAEALLMPQTHSFLGYHLRYQKALTFLIRKARTQIVQPVNVTTFHYPIRKFPHEEAIGF